MNNLFNLLGSRLDLGAERATARRRAQPGELSKATPWPGGGLTLERRRRSSRGLISAFMVIAILGWAWTAKAQSDVAELDHELEQLAEGEASALVPEEIERARELLDLAVTESEAGNRQTARALLQLVPIQIRLIRELVSAVRAERSAGEAEAHLVELERRRRLERLSLEQVLERLLSLRPARQGLTH